MILQFSRSEFIILSRADRKRSAISLSLRGKRFQSSCSAKVGAFYFGGARSKGFAMLRNVSKLPFFDKIGRAKSVGFRFYLVI